MTIEEMSVLLNKKNIHLNQNQKDMFLKYMELLLDWNQKINLTAIKTPDEIVEKHFFDSLTLTEAYHLDSQKIIDVGSGAGFPGIPLKIVFPDTEIKLLEPTGKRANFLKLVIEELGLSKIEVISDRAENISSNQREHFDLAVARAVAPLNILNELCIPFVKVQGTFIALKGPGAEEEAVLAANSLVKLSSHIQTIFTTNLITNNDIRKLIMIQKDKATSVKYPRNFSEIKKKPL